MLAFLQRFHMLTSECKSQLLAASYNAAGLVPDDRAITLTCGVQGVLLTRLVHPLHTKQFVRGLGAWATVFVVGAK